MSTVSRASTPPWFKLRFAVFMTGVIFTFSILGIRAADVQLVQGQKYLQLADNNRFFTQVLPAQRGVLLDRYHEPLVWNRQVYFRVKSADRIYQNRTPISREEALQAMVSSTSSTVVTETERMYRYPYALAHTTGYVGDVTAEDLARDSTLHIAQQIGKAGLEFTQEKALQGRDGKQVFEINALGQKQRQVSQVEPVQGQDIATSLDPYLTEVASQALKGLKGTAIVTDVESGKILTLTSQPSFDPNILSQSSPEATQEAVRKASVQQLFKHPDKLFFNRAISGAYPQGSVFKIVTSLAGLELGKITSSTEVVDTGVIKIGEFEFGNWYYRQYGRVEGAISLVRAIARSNDTYFYKVAEWVGPDNLAIMARAFGLGAKTGIELPAESRGLVPDSAWKENFQGERWYLGDTYHVGIGQGNLLTSPIQVAQMTQAVGNDGQLCKVSLLRDAVPECRDMALKAENVELVLSGMMRACSAGGTAFPFFPYNATRFSESNSAQQNLEAGAVACKTGTAEFGGEDEKGYRKTHGWFTMAVELPEFKQELAEETAASESADLKKQWQFHVQKHGFPRKISITVLVESDDAVPFREGSRDAGPIAKQILDWMVMP